MWYQVIICHMFFAYKFSQPRYLQHVQFPINEKIFVPIDGKEFKTIDICHDICNQLLMLYIYQENDSKLWTNWFPYLKHKGWSRRGILNDRCMTDSPYYPPPFPGWHHFGSKTTLCSHNFCWKNIELSYHLMTNAITFFLVDVHENVWTIDVTKE